MICYMAHYLALDKLASESNLFSAAFSACLTGACKTCDAYSTSNALIIYWSIRIHSQQQAVKFKPIILITAPSCFETFEQQAIKIQPH